MRDVVGVGWVTNDLVVKSTTGDDLTLQHKVRSALDSDCALFGEKIDAYVEDYFTLREEVQLALEERYSWDYMLWEEANALNANTKRHFACYSSSC